MGKQKVSPPQKMKFLKKEPERQWMARTQYHKGCVELFSPNFMAKWFCQLRAENIIEHAQGYNYLFYEWLIIKIIIFIFVNKHQKEAEYVPDGNLN